MSTTEPPPFVCVSPHFWSYFERLFLIYNWNSSSQKYFKNCKENPEETFEEPSLLTTFFSYLGFCLLVIIGHFNQFLFKQKISEERHREGYVPLFEPFGRFYRRYVYRRSKDCVDRAICSVPGDTLVIKDWISRDCNWTLEFTGTETKCINMGSYNYLGFAQNKGPCADQSIEALERYGIATCSPRRELGKLRRFLKPHTLF